MCLLVIFAVNKVVKETKSIVPVCHMFVTTFLTLNP